MRMHGGGDSEIDGCGNTTAKSTGVGTNEHAAAAIAAPQWAACPAAWHDLRRVPLPSTAPCCKRSPCGRSALPLQWGRRHLPPPVSHSYSFFNALQDLTEEELTQLREEVDKYTVEGDLRRFNALNIKRLKEIGCYRGRRHYNNLPVRVGGRGQLTGRGGVGGALQCAGLVGCLCRVVELAMVRPWWPRPGPAEWQCSPPVIGSMCRSCSSQGGVVKHLKLCCLAGPLRGRSTVRMAAVMACQPNPLPAHHIILFLCTAAIKLCRFAARGRRTTRAQGRGRLSPLPVRREVAGQPRSITLFRAFRAFLEFLRPFALYG